MSPCFGCEHIVDQSTVCIIGYGVVGKAIESGIRERCGDTVSVIIHDPKYIDNSDKIASSDISFVCVDTQFNNIDGTYSYLNLRNVLNMFKDISYKGLIVIKSTVHPGFISSIIIDNPNLRIVANPEFLTARTASKDFLHQEWIVIGGNEENSKQLVDFYNKWWPSASIINTTPEAAVMMKCISNCFFATKVSLMNEFYVLWTSMGRDWSELKRVLEFHPWIGKKHLDVPGPDGKLGFGGTCFPKEVKAMIGLMNMFGTTNNILPSVIRTCEELRGKD